PTPGKREPAVNAQSAENFLVARQHIAESREITGGRFRERHAAGAAAGAVTERSGLQHQDGLLRSKPPQPRGRRKAGETASNNSEVHKIRKSARNGTEINAPGRRAPRMRLAYLGIALNFAAHSISLMQREQSCVARISAAVVNDVFVPPADQLFGGDTRAKRTAAMPRALTRRGNHTGESHGTGIKNSTSGSLTERGQRTVAQRAA